MKQGIRGSCKQRRKWHRAFLAAVTAVATSSPLAGAADAATANQAATTTSENRNIPQNENNEPKSTFLPNSKFKDASSVFDKVRNLWGSGSDGGSYTDFLADSSVEYDPWQQAYRLLGVYVDCDHPQSLNTWDYDNNPYYTEDVNNAQCARYYIWCAYVDPNYQGGGRSEYYNGDNNLDCHQEGSAWELLGCYRQEMYNTVEQLSKHLWSYDDEEYEIMCNALTYMTKYDCRQIGYASDGSALYAGVKPISGGYISMGLYTDSNCLYDDDSGYTYDDFYTPDYSQQGSGSHDNHRRLDGSSSYYTDYNMEDANGVMDGFKYCTHCMDYPTYQDGNVNGDNGYDDDDLINQCWKFWSHASYPCTTDCIAMASAQGTILSVPYNNFNFGSSSVSDATSSYSSGSTIDNSVGESNFDRMKANAFLILTSVVFIASFLSFGVARSSLPKTRTSDGGGGHSRLRSSRSKSRAGASRKSSRSKSRSRRILDEDFEDEVPARHHRSSRSKSRSRRSRSRSRAAAADAASTEMSYDEEQPQKRSSSRKQRSSKRSSKYEAPSVPERSSRRNQDEMRRRERDDF